MPLFSPAGGFPAPAITRSSFVMGSKESKAQQRVLDAQNQSVSRYGGQNSHFRELSRYYLSLSPTLIGRENDRPLNPNDNQSPDLFVSRFFTVIEQMAPTYIFSVLGQTPRVYARKPDDDDSAGAVQAMLKYDWERSDVIQRSQHVVKQMLKYGTGIAKIGYRYDEYDVTRPYERTIPLALNDDFTARATRTDRLKRKETVTRFDGPWLEHWSVFNFHPDPFYAHLHEMRWVNAARWTDRKTLKLEDENHYRHTGKHLYQHLDRIPAVKKGYAEEMYQMDSLGDDIAEAMGWSRQGGIYRNRYTHTRGHKETQEDDLVYVLEHWSRDDKLIMLANGETPIMDGPHPYDDKDMPFAVMRCHVIDNQFWGYGMLHPIKRSQEELNSWRNLAMRQGALNVAQVWGYDQSIGLSDAIDDLVPGGVYGIPFHANGKPGLVPLFDGANLPPEAYNIEDRIDRDIMLATGMPGYRQQVQGNTATEASLEAAMIEARARLLAMDGELSYANEIARLFHSRRQQYLSSEGQVFRILGPKGTSYENLTPGDIAGEYDFLTAGQNIHASRDVMRQQLLQAIALIKGDPSLLAITDMPEVWQEFWKMMDFPYPERFYSPPPQRVWEPKHENIVLSQGEWVDVEPNDDHELHIAEHRKAYGDAVGQGSKALERLQEHIRQHEQFMKQSQAQAPPQEEPGLRGYAGNQPNLENATESEAGLQARMRGGAATR